MPKKSFEINVKPDVLVWARETIGRDLQEVAKRLNVSPESVKKWESGEKKPTLVQVKKLATYYKRPLAVFFLPTPPKEPSLPNDFRTLPDEIKLPLSPQTRLAIRKARRLQSLALELEEYFHKPPLKRLGKIKLTDDPETAANKAREHLKLFIEDQLSWKSEKEAFAQWRKSIESLGGFVFQIPWPIEEARAFSLTDGPVPTIILNSKDSSRARIFSLLHEFGHLLLENGGICIPERVTAWEISKAGISEETKEVEVFCNHFAGATLVPEKPLLQHELVIDVKSPREWSDRNLGRLANRFWVSREVILRRLLIFNKTSDNFYRRKREEWIAKERGKEKKVGGQRNPPIECIQKNGIPFVALVLNSYRNDKITYSDVADYLDIRVKHLPKVEKLLEAGI